MSDNYKYNHWYKVSEFLPEVYSSIYFKTITGGIYPGTFLNYSQFCDLDGKIYELNEVESWIIREDWQVSEGVSKNDTIEFNKQEITIRLKKDRSFYWEAVTTINGKKIIMRKPTREMALEAIKKEIKNN